MNYFDSYLSYLKTSCPAAIPSVEEIKDSLVDALEKHLDFSSHETGLLLGNVQSGKSGMMFGAVAHLADAKFKLFVILTTDNVSLYNQTLKRTIESLDNFNVCGEDDEIRFKSLVNRKPTTLVLKKNYRVLQRWKDNILTSPSSVRHRPIAIIDDEADASSLNTKVNSGDISTINRLIGETIEEFPSGLYLQVTATPQAVLLQEDETQHSPKFCLYSEPSNAYLGGNFFFNSDSDQPNFVPYPIFFTGEDELAQLMDDPDSIPEGLRSALQAFLLSVANQLEGATPPQSANMLIHPSHKIDDHQAIDAKVAKLLGEFTRIVNRSGSEAERLFNDIFTNLRKTKPDIKPLAKLIERISTLLKSNGINRLVYNSQGETDRDVSRGVNIIIGGNSLGRGVTFPNLLTSYYCRRSRSPQIDTCWQHCRSFGYDRDKGLVRLFTPPSIFGVFTQINEANNLLINQIANQPLDEIRLITPRGVRPTRNTVVNQDALSIIIGGASYFPTYPIESPATNIEELLSELANPNGVIEVDLGYIKRILSELSSEEFDSWRNTDFIDAISSLQESGHSEVANLIIRRDRNITKGTGTLISASDRRLSKTYKDKVVLILYLLRGSVENEWSGEPFWIGNIKLPEGKNFSRVSQS